MYTLESRGIVRRVIEEDGEFLVSFPNHDGYFKVPESANSASFMEKILESKRDNKEIVFTFDRDLNIMTVV